MATEITVYSKPRCVQCDWTKRKLDALGATYQVIDVTEDDEALNHIRGLGYTQVPVVVVGEHHWYGFSPDRLEWAVRAAYT